jgi:hypothetical protein
MRTTIARQRLPGGYSGQSLNAIMTACDASNGNASPLQGGEFLLVRNSGASARVFSITSVADPFGRSGDISETIQAGETRLYGPFLISGWRQNDGSIYYSGAHAELLVAFVGHAH